MRLAKRSLLAVLCTLALTATAENRSSVHLVTIQNSELVIEASQADGTYTVRSTEKVPLSVAARVGAKVNGQWVFSTQYAQHKTVTSAVADNLGESSQILMSNTGLAGQPDLICALRLHSKPAFAEIQVEVRNSTEKPVTVQGIRVLETQNSPVISMGASESSERVLSDSWSEDRPSMSIRDFADAPDGMHRGVGSQLIYNRDSKRSFFVGALTSEKWLTVLRLRIDPKQPNSIAYEVDSTGTTELTEENSLRNSGPEDRIELSLPLAPGQSLLSERVMASFSNDYHAQLEFYGDVIRRLHHARVSAPTPIGWWSWTAYYFGLNEGAALTNANFLAARLKDKGYEFFHIDEGYQYARGEYSTTNADKFPSGMKSLEYKVQRLGLTPGIWTAPFEVSERSWVYQNHKDWLVHNPRGEPIHAGYVTEDSQTKKKLDQLYVLDTTNPDAQDYLRKTYATLTKEWGIRYIKLDFMEDSAVEGYYHRPNTTALEAQRIGLQVIRQAVGSDVLLDKDGSPILNPVGLVDIGRTSVDTGHTFEASKEAAPGIAARYYMNRNFFISDPDAFSVSRQAVVDEEWHGGKRPLTLDEARVSIALSAVSGGMFEIGDDLPTLFLDADRMALVENRDLIDMARYAHASKPLDLMTYAPEDGLPNVFLLQESKRQSVLTVFNWTDRVRQHRFTLSGLGLGSHGHNQILDVFDPKRPVGENLDSISLDLAPRSVRMLKIIDTSVPAAAPTVSVHVQDHGKTGTPAQLSAVADADGVPAVSYSWDFGDGTTARVASVTHTFTHDGLFNVRLRADGIEGVSFEKTFTVMVVGRVDTRFAPERFQRYTPER